MTNKNRVKTIAIEIVERFAKEDLEPEEGLAILTMVMASTIKMVGLSKEKAFEAMKDAVLIIYKEEGEQ